MNLNVTAVPTNLWLIQTIAMTLLTGGFMVYDMSLWRAAFVQYSPHAKWYRIALVAVPVLFSSLMLYGGALGKTESIAFINAGLFGLTIPLFDERISVLEFDLRTISVLCVWLLTHAFTVDTGVTLISSLALLSLLVIIQKKPASFRYHPGLLIGTQFIFGALFWLSLPWDKFGIAMDPTLLWQALAMYAVISSYTALYWYHDHKRTLRNQQLEALAAYDVIASSKHYRDNQADIAELLRVAQNGDRPLTVAALDVDFFQKFNQVYGHMAGNATLMQLLNLLNNHLAGITPKPHVYSTAGEEFTIAFPDMDAQTATKTLTAYLHLVQATEFEVDDTKAHLTISAGLTAIKPSDTSIDSVYKRADDSLYLSKKRGRNVVTCDGQTNLETVTDQELAFFAQPIMCDASGHLEQFADELLLRAFDQNTDYWRLPKRFDIDVETQISLIRKTLQQNSCPHVTINLTAEQFADTTTASALAGFAQADYGPDRLTVEITSIPDLATTRRVTALYRDANIRILIDDVGSDNSYELINQLLPYVDGVKFAIQNLRKTESLARIRNRVSFWAETTSTHQLDLILEGIEDEQDLAFAKSLGIHYFQGYYFSKPVNLAA